MKASRRGQENFVRGCVATFLSPSALRTGIPCLLIILLLVLPALIPRDAAVLEVSGVDAWHTHRSFFGTRIVAQSFSAPASRMHGIALFLTPYTRQKPLQGKIKLTLHDAGGKTLREAEIEAASIREGKRTQFYFTPLPLKKGQLLELRLQAPELEAGNAVAVRFDPNPDAIIPGTMFWKGQPYPGDLAMQVLVPSNYYGELWAIWKRKKSWRELSLISLFVAFILVSWPLVWRKLSPPRRLCMVGLSVIVFLGLLLYLRIQLLPQVQGVSGGDPYNYLFILQRLREGENPYLHAKRLPGFPLLLLPFSYFVDDILLAARWLNQVAVALILLLLLILGRQLGFSWFTVWLAAFIAAASRPLLFTPFRPLAYPWLAVAVLLTLVILFRGKFLRGWQVWAASVVIGWGMQTRQEAFAVFAVLSLGILALALLKRRWWLLAAWFLPAFLLSLPFLGHNWLTYGNPFYSPYFDHPVTNIYLSSQEWWERASVGWGVLSSLWWQRWAHEWRMPGTVVWGTILFLVLVAGGKELIAFGRLKGGNALRWKSKRELWSWGKGFGLIIATGLGWHYAAYHEEEWLRWAAGVWWALALAGGVLVGWFSLRFFRFPRTLAFPRAWKLILTFLVAFVLWLVPTWAHPALKSYVALIPFVALGAALAAGQFLNPSWGEKISRWARSWHGVAAILLLALLAQAPLATARTVSSMIEHASLRQMKEELLYQAALALKSEEGKVAAKYQYLALKYFLPDRVEEYPEKDTAPPLAELRARGVRFLLWTSWDNLFRPYLTLPEGVELWREWQGEDLRGKKQILKILQLRTPSSAEAAKGNLD
jgi:hypothetical protein